MLLWVVWVNGLCFKGLAHTYPQYTLQHTFLTPKLQHIHNQQSTHNPNLLLDIIVIQNHSSSEYHTFYVKTTYNIESLT